MATSGRSSTASAMLGPLLRRGGSLMKRQPERVVITSRGRNLIIAARSASCRGWKPLLQGRYRGWKPLLQGRHRGWKPLLPVGAVSDRESSNLLPQLPNPRIRGRRPLQQRRGPAGLWRGRWRCGSSGGDAGPAASRGAFRRGSARQASLRARPKRHPLLR